MAVPKLDLPGYSKLIQLALVAAGFFLVVPEIEDPVASQLVILACAFVFGRGTYDRHGGRDATFFSLAAGLVVVAFGGLACWTRQPEPEPYVPAETVAAALAAVAFYAAARRGQRTPDSFGIPNVLLSTFPGSEVREAGGVQFAGVLHPGTGIAPHWLELFVQNCLDAQRSVRLRFDGAMDARFMRFQPEVPVELGPSQVVRVRMPVVSPTYAGTYSLFFEPEVLGEGGNRVRRWRAAPVQKRVKPGEIAASALLGHVHIGAGDRFLVGPLQADIWSQPLPPPEIEVLWPSLGSRD